jgi:uncharacterized lipoprotein YajG
MLRNRLNAAVPRIVTLVSALICGGCPYTPEYIDIPYESSIAVRTPIAAAESVTVSVQVEDARTVYRDRVGSKINRYLKDAAPIIANNDVIAAIGAAVAAELSRRGFTIGPGGVHIDIAVRQFYNHFEVGNLFDSAVADFDTFVTVRGANGRITLSKHYVAQGTMKNMFATASNARDALIEAMTEGVMQIVSDPQFIGAIFGARTQ